MARLGEPSCVPIDDCAKLFPPADAELIVSTRHTGERVVSTIAEAVRRASAGATIAIDAGEFASTNLRRDVRLVGRCARDTILGDGTHNALYVDGGANVDVAGVTLVGDSATIAVARGSVNADRVVVRAVNMGIAAAGKGAHITFRRSVIDGLPKQEGIRTA